MPNALELFGQKVKEMRINKGLSQEKLAEMSAVHRNYIGRIERAEKNVGFIHILKVSVGLNVRIQDLVKHIPKLTHQDIPEPKKTKKGKKEK